VRPGRFRLAAPGGGVDLGRGERAARDRGVEALEARAAQHGLRRKSAMRTTHLLPDFELLVVHRREVRVPAFTLESMPAARPHGADRRAEARPGAQHNDGLAGDPAAAPTGLERSLRQVRDRFGDRAEIVHDDGAGDARRLRKRRGSRQTPAFVRSMQPSVLTGPAPPKPAAANSLPAAKRETFARTSGVVLVSSRPDKLHQPSARAASARRVRVPPTSQTRIISPSGHLAGRAYPRAPR
jgi:hypothetical protein